MQLRVIDKLTNALVKFRVPFAAVAISLLVVFSFLINVPKIDSRLSGYNIDHNPYDSIALRMASLFASSNFVQVLVKPEHTSVSILFQGLEEVENEIKNSFPDIRVESLRSASAIIYRKVKQDSPVKDGLIAALNIPIAQNLISRDTSSVLMLAFADGVEDFDSDLFNSIIEKQFQGIESMQALSISHIQKEMERSIERDSKLLLPLILVFILGFLFISYRSITAVLFCITVVCISIVPSLFFLTIFNVNINQVTVTIIPVVVILSLSTSVHLITGYMHQSSQDDKNIRVYETLTHYLTPCFLSTITTAIAFGSFYFSDSLYIRQFGTVTALSIIVVFLLTYSIAPLTLQFVRAPKKGRFPLQFTIGIEKFLQNNRKSISIGFFLIVFISVFFISAITFNINIETYIPRNSKVYNSSQEIKKAFHSLTEIDLLIEPSKAPTDSSNIGDLRRELVSVVVNLTNDISKYPEVSSVQSIKHQTDFENNFLIPGFRMTLFPRSRNPFVSRDQMNYRINIKLAHPEDIWVVKDRLANDFSKFEPRFKYSQYSDFLFFHYISTSVTNSLLKSLLFSALLITLIILLLTFSLKITFISVIANAIPLGFLVMIFVVFGIDMNITTSISLIICLGLIVDDTIHILYRRVRLAEPLKELGFGILTTSIIITGGFLSFIVSQSHPNQVFGIICAIVFIIAAISDMTVLQWLLKLQDTKKTIQ